MGTANMYNVKALTASAQLNGTDEGHLMGILLAAGSANAKLKLSEDGDGSGANVLVVEALANDSQWVDLSHMGGINLTQAYATLTGTGVEVFVFWE